LAALAAVAAVSVASRARADSCTLYPNANHPAGTGVGVYLSSDVTTTQATGSPNNSSWASTGSRIPGSTLTAFGSNNNATSVEIQALESDVALYLFDGADFNGIGQVVHCKKGRVCTVNALPSRMDNKTSSFICQREFYRKAFGDDARKALNPIIKMSTISGEVDDKVTDLLAGNDDIDNLRHTNSEDGATLWSRTVWMNKTDFCPRFGWTCTTADRFVDYMRISKRFEIDVNAGVGNVIGPDDDYVIQLDWYVRPVLSGTGFQLRFWWAVTDVWVEGGTYHDRVFDSVSSEVDGVDIQAELRQGVLDAATAAGCGAACIDGNQRLQMSLYDDADVGTSQFTKTFDMTSTHAKIVLNRTRDAAY